MTFIPTFEAKGDAFAIGVALGQRAGHALREVVPGIARFAALDRDWGGSDYIATLERAGRNAFPGHMREIEGIAEGAGVPFNRVFLWNCRGDVPGGGDQTGKTEAAGCTSFMLPGAGGGSGRRPAVIGHNEDGEAEEDGHCFLVRLVPEDGPAITSFYNPGLLPGHSFGWNDHGLVQTINHIRPFDQREGIPRHLITRAVLSCESLDRAVALLQRRDRASGFHHNLGQAGDGPLLSVEAPASGCSVRPIERPHCHANHLVHDAFVGLQQADAPSSMSRQARGEALLAAERAADVARLLADQETAPLPIYRKRVGGEDAGFTLASGLFEIGVEVVDWRVHHRLDDPPLYQGRITVRQPTAAPTVLS